MSPPPLLDGARVLWWAWAGDVPFGQLPGAEGDNRFVYGFAVCRYDGGRWYRFTCNKHWEVVQDMDHDDEEEAKADIPTQYDASRVAWHHVSTSEDAR
ncbi:hypothetical protein GobsT_56840 [Gemmata obscuriglobus]|uniref:Uncharacterized protein n=1 Tax=Gemmata obscuriglobus TaxID=114 RepID=A0A2Z3GTA9_9BACT|nr:hypothetical protein [Gemmata obscuriglobus]AWM36508.1 hypothetical protein C1280_05370 [Gemmata obscuriglobus]QEG30866.1 hypothetical protein GobsT_56840 [Gemmata obscuriglobus]VTS08123.1 Uncharacterized protein OS=Janthinobacterium lividum GN=NC77_19235 PE=4 SV=1 [Gemmata obscuriglobus UQM 2246]VTS10199.1 Uncharacterized protein OS=Janthinobacterium lividum GN=NC77_19235 PE=4 SV=1 [Gemmata obscuriglobus UQM 2246]